MAGGVGCPGATLPAVSLHACSQRPSCSILASTSLTNPRNAVSPFFTPIPYGSLVNGLPTSSNDPASLLINPNKMTLSVVTASTCPFLSASAHLEYTSNSVSLACG